MRKQMLMTSALMVLVLMSFTLVSAKTTVTGVILDPSFNFLADANVNVSCNTNVLQTTSFSDGVYAVEYFEKDCKTGDTVNVTAISDDGTLFGTGAGIVHDKKDGEGTTVNVATVLVILIPEFGFILGTLTLLSAIGIFFVVRRD
ncbi:MAG: hypothetical protein IH845_05080 [Nanoarchaeota archaeon]|nr:hypothetical protein [Nanoarchaeota archaeon]